MASYNILRMVIDHNASQNLVVNLVVRKIIDPSCGFVTIFARISYKLRREGGSGLKNKFG